jgi:hypothetical protein
MDMERAGIVVLVWFAIGCFVALVVGQIIRKGGRTHDWHPTVAQRDSGLQHPTEVERGEHRSVERASQSQELRHHNEQ